MSKKKIIFKIIFFIAVTALTIFYLITSGVFEHVSDLKKVSILGIFFVFFTVMLYVFADSFIIYRSIKKVRGNANFIDGIGVYTFGNLGAGITPWKSAHFPMIGYFLHKRGYNTEEVLSIMARNQLVYSITLPFLYLVILFYSIITNQRVLIGNLNIPLWIFSFLGIITNIFYLVVLFLLLYNLSFQRFIVKIEAKILFKFKKIEDINKYIEEKELKLSVYKKTADSFFKSWYKNIPSVIAYIIFMLAINGVPYVTYLALSKATFSITDYLYCFMLCQAMSYVTNIIPVPGGMAAIEFSFLTVYEPFMGSIVNLAVLVYRFFTYILLILIDFAIFISFQIYWKIKNSKIKEDNVV